MCLFCQIINKEIPNYTVYEDDFVLAFLDIHPCCKGHTVVIPKRHVENILELTDEEITKYNIAIKKIVEKLKEKLNPDGFNVGFNHGEAGGQAINHLHIHILPRWDSDGGGSMHSIIKNQGDETIEEVFEKIK